MFEHHALAWRRVGSGNRSVGRERKAPEHAKLMDAQLGVAENGQRGGAEIPSAGGRVE